MDNFLCGTVPAMTTLAERLKIAMEGPPKIQAADLARAAKVKPPSVSAWMSGDTKNIGGKYLVKVAERLGVRPEWLAYGTGQMRAPGITTAASSVPRPRPDEADITLVSGCIDDVNAALAMLGWPPNHEMRQSAIKWVHLHRLQGIKITVEMIADTLAIFEE